MKRSAKSLIGYTIGATDGEIGKVKEFYFDDETWTIRYLIVETGNWLSGRKVLISPKALLTPDWEKKVFPLNLTKQQIKNSPDIDTEKPVSRQQEIVLNEHYELENYWNGGFYGGGLPLPMHLPGLQEPVIKKVDGDVHLRSTNEITGYKVKASDGGIGDVEDFLIDDKTWKLDFMVADTNNWFPGKKILLSPKWIKEIKWDISTVIVNDSVEHLKNSPEYDPSNPISEAYELKLHNHYDKLIPQFEDKGILNTF
jgi:sporulation protein YlmC with PRC-barrel domain